MPTQALVSGMGARRAGGVVGRQGAEIAAKLQSGVRGVNAHPGGGKGTPFGEDKQSGSVLLLPLALVLLALSLALALALSLALAKGLAVLVVVVVAVATILVGAAFSVCGG